MSILLISTSKLVAQTAAATSSATIVTSVGAELSIDTDDPDVINKMAKATAGISSDNSKDIRIPFLKIIGNTFSHSFMILNENVIINKSVIEMGIVPLRKKESFVSITVNFD